MQLLAIIIANSPANLPAKAKPEFPFDVLSMIHSDSGELSKTTMHSKVTDADSKLAVEE